MEFTECFGKTIPHKLKMRVNFTLSGSQDQGSIKTAVAFKSSTVSAVALDSEMFPAQRKLWEAEFFIRERGHCSVHTVTLLSGLCSSPSAAYREKLFLKQDCFVCNTKKM